MRSALNQSGQALLIHRGHRAGAAMAVGSQTIGYIRDRTNAFKAKRETAHPGCALASVTMLRHQFAKLWRGSPVCTRIVFLRWRAGTVLSRPLRSLSELVGLLRNSAMPAS